MKKEILEWLLKRNISEKTLAEARISFEDGKIVIPVFDQFGHHIFSKRRKDPFDKGEGPKYTYEAGSMASLYNVHTVVDLRNERIFLTEGELDCLLLNSLGFNAVSSTGGASMFKVEWAEFLKGNEVFIAYDRDDAGIRGALKAQKMMPFAKIIFLPYDTKGKDITDYFQTHSKEQFEKLVREAERWTLPYDPFDIPTTKSGIDAIVRELNEADSALLERQRRLVQEGKETAHIEVLFEMIRNRREHWQKQRKLLGRIIKPGEVDDVKAAKSVPMTTYMKFNLSGFAPCPFHHEKTPSFKYYPERNSAYCFACNFHADTIDVVQKINGCSFKEALKIILRK